MRLSIQKVNKTYRNGVKALQDINLELEAGMFGLLGPNGAGKSSLMRTIATLQFPDSGRIFFRELDIFAKKTTYRKTLGYLPQAFGVYPRESALSLLNYFAVLKGIASKKDRKRQVAHVLEVTNLSDVQHERVSTFSGGMRQRFGIAQLLLNQPALIVVDEPTAGLDPAERTKFLNVLRHIGSENIVLFSTHYVEDVQVLCKRLAVMNKGQILAQTDPIAATHNLQGKIWETFQTIEVLEQQNIPFVILSNKYDEQNRLTHRIYAERAVTTDSIPVQPKLEDYYFLTLNHAAK